MKKFFGLMIMVLTLMSVMLVGCQHPTGGQTPTQTPTSSDSLTNIISGLWYKDGDFEDENAIFFNFDRPSNNEGSVIYSVISGEYPYIIEENSVNITFDNNTIITFEYLVINNIKKLTCTNIDGSGETYGITLGYSYIRCNN